MFSFHHRGTARRRLSDAARAGVEQLERRRLFTTVLDGTTIAITGTNDNDTIVVHYNRLSGGYWVEVNGLDEGSFSLGEVNGVFVNAGTGDDYVWSDSAGLPYTVNGGDGADSIRGGLGADLLNGDGGNDSIDGSDGNDNVSGGTDADKLWGGTGDDYLGGAGGNDTLFGDAGADTLAGATGNDTVDYQSAVVGQNIAILLDNYANDGGSAFGADNVYSNNETVLAGAGDDYLIGNGGINSFFGGAGNDYIEAGDGIDWVNGYEGNDTIYGQGGNDSLEGANGNDRLYGGLGTDTMGGNAHNDILYANDGVGEADIVSGGIGTDSAYSETDDILSGIP